MNWCKVFLGFYQNILIGNSLNFVLKYKYMEINELNKKQLVLLTLLITFVVSIATGIITVSLMKQMPPTVPQTINNVIQRTIEKVTTVEQSKNQGGKTENVFEINDDRQLVSIFKKSESIATGENNIENNSIEVGQGVIVSDEGLILVNTSTIENENKYEVLLGSDKYNVHVLKKFENGFIILKIGEEELNTKPIKETPETNNQNTD